MGTGTSTSKKHLPAENPSRMSSQEFDLSVYGVPGCSPFVNEWQVYVGCTVEALLEAPTEETQPQEAVGEWQEGTIIQVTDALLVEEEEQRGIFFLVR